MNTLEITLTYFPKQCVWIGLTVITLLILLPRWRASSADRMAAISLVPSVIGCVLFVVCFPIGHASSVRQMTESGREVFWSVWAISFMFLVLAMMLSAVIALISVFRRPRNSIHSYAGRVLAVITAIFGWFGLGQLFPSA